MTLYEFLKRFTERSQNENILLLIACGKVYEGQMRDIPASYFLRAYTVKKTEVDWDNFRIVVELNGPEENE